MVDWSKTAVVFPGQGSQEVGMGADLAEAYPVVRAVFDEADERLGFSLSTLCFEGPADALNDTINTQPALFVMGVALFRLLRERLGATFSPAFLAGHSLGEYTALAAAGAVSFGDGLALVRERGRLMQEAGVRSPGSMAAVLGLSVDVVQDVCRQIAAETQQALVIANDNCDGQLVISGAREAVEQAVPVLNERGARRVVPLAVSVASHSPLMASITPEFGAVLAGVSIHAPEISVVGNVTSAPLQTADAIRTELSAQLTSTVRWTESVNYMIGAGANTFVELGPKDVLTGLVKRIDRSAQRHTLNSAGMVEAFLKNE